MRTTTQLVLVLMGGGALTAGAAVSMESGRACGEARARLDPRAEEICRAHGTGYLHSSHIWSGGYGGGGWSGGTTGVRAVSRGGFGLFGMRFSGFHG